MKKFLVILLLLAMPFLQGCLALLASAAASYGIYQIFKK